MINLLKVDFKRLFLRVTPIVLFIISVLFGFIYSSGVRANFISFYDATSTLNLILFLLSIFIVIYLSMFVSKDYSYNTIRNKIVSGNSRINIYLSKMISCILFSLVIYGGFILASYIGISVCDIMTPKYMSGFIKTTIIFGSLSIFNTGLILLLCNLMRGEYGFISPMVVSIVGFFVHTFSMMVRSDLADFIDLFIPFRYLFTSFEIRLSSSLYGSIILIIEGLVLLLVGYILYRRCDVN